MKINIGNVSSGYHFISFIAAVKGMSEPPTPQSVIAAIEATMPIAPKTRCPVRSITIIDENIRPAIISFGMTDLLASDAKNILYQF